MGPAKFVHDKTHKGVKVVGFLHDNHGNKTGLLLLFSARPPLLHDPPPIIVATSQARACLGEGIGVRVRVTATAMGTGDGKPTTLR